MYQDPCGNWVDNTEKPYMVQEEDRNQKNHMALASMVLGILSIVTACCFFPGLILGGLAVLFGALSKVEEQLRGQAIVGIITGIIGITLGAASFVMWIALAV